MEEEKNEGRMLIVIKTNIYLTLTIFQVLY